MGLMSYDNGAEVYSRVMAPVLAGARRPLSEAPLFKDLEVALDIGTGPGLLLKELREFRPKALLVGIDVSPRMLALAPKEFPLVCMNAGQLAFDDASFDAAFMSFVLTTFSDPVVCLQEARRVLSPGGALGLATWHSRESEALRQWVSALEEAGAEPVEDQKDRANEPSKVIGLLEEAGFIEIQCWTSSFSFVLSPEDFIELRSKLGMSAERLSSISPKERQELCDGFEELLRSMSPEQRTEGRCRGTRNVAGVGSNVGLLWLHITDVVLTSMTFGLEGVENESRR